MINSERNTGQYLIPLCKEVVPGGRYDIYPAYSIGREKIFHGFDSLADKLAGYNRLIIDGYGGLFFERIIDEISRRIRITGKKVSVYNIGECLKSEEEISTIIEPFLGGDDPLFGTRATIGLEELFDPSLLASVSHDSGADVSIIFGVGAALAGCEGLLVYIDIPKNEIQYRARAGAVTNLGASEPAGSREMYKRFYFVDWVLLNRHKEKIIGRAGIVVDGQRPGEPVWIEGVDLREGLKSMSREVIRVRPWFEPGTWGGRWIMDNIPGLNRDVPNYAWSFELIVPENGLILESDGFMLEVSFDTLMFLFAPAVLGDCHERFGTDFPIRFDFLDTIDGGNLSVQCHPRPGYTSDHFGEEFTQEETYYILDAKDNSMVYLGFNRGVNSCEFRRELERSQRDGVEADIERFVNSVPVSKHDLLLIPYGTIHGSGKNNMVLEISSTPYIFTFKLYDWLRPDLDGPRPLNIDRGMENLFFERQGDYINEKLISKPLLIDSGEGWELYHLPTHETHFMMFTGFILTPLSLL
ncbi:MAG: class I mannose-6-phosphate isomerase [Bacteroidales bacterium]